MEYEEPLCSFDSTWEDSEGEEEAEQSVEVAQSRRIVRWNPGSILYACIVKFLSWIHWTVLFITGRKNEEKNGPSSKNVRRTNEGKNLHNRKTFFPMNEGIFSQRNLRAARDMQTYRHEYPGLQEEDSSDQPNLDFYLNKIKFQPNGVCIEELLNNWKRSYDILEHSHSYIQWLFPLREPGMNWCAQPLSAKELQEFKVNEEVRKRFVQAYELMLDFYGIKLEDNKTGKLTRAHNYKARYQNLDRHSHNNLRITRILKCLGEIGYEPFQVKLVKFFLKETLVEDMLPSVKQSALDYFLFTVRDRKRRQRLVHYAWFNFENKKRFVWGPHEQLKDFKKPKSSKHTSISSTDTVSFEDENAAPGSRESLLQGVQLEGGGEEELAANGSADATSKGGGIKEASREERGPKSKELETGSAAKEASGNSVHREVFNQDEGGEGQHPSLDGSTDTSPETTKDGRKRKLLRMEQEDATKTLQTENHLVASVSEQFTGDTLSAESSKVENKDDAPLPAHKKKKGDAEETENAKLEQEPNQSNGPIQLSPTHMLPLVPMVAGAIKETVQSADVEGEGFSTSSIRPVCTAEEEHDVKEDFTVGKGRPTEMMQDVEEAANHSSQIDGSMLQVGTTQESSLEKQDVEEEKEGHVKTENKEMIRDVNAEKLYDGLQQEKGVASLSHEPPGETKYPDQVEVLGASVQTSSSVSYTAPLGQPTDTEDNVRPNRERDPGKGSSVIPSVQNEPKQDTDLTVPHFDRAEQEKDEIHGTGRQVQCDQSPTEQWDCKLLQNDEVKVSNCLTEQVGSKTSLAADGVDERKSLAKQEGSKPLQAPNGAEASKSLTEQEGPQPVEAADDKKANGVPTGQQKCKPMNASKMAQANECLIEQRDCKSNKATDTPSVACLEDGESTTEQRDCEPAQAADGINDYESKTEQVDCKPVQSADWLNDSKKTAEQQDCKSVQAAEVKGGESITEQGDCKLLQAADVAKESINVTEQESSKPVPATSVMGVHERSKEQ